LGSDLNKYHFLSAVDHHWPLLQPVAWLAGGWDPRARSVTACCSSQRYVTSY